MAARGFLLLAALSLAQAALPVDTPPSGLAPFKADTCPQDLQCAEPPSLRPEIIYDVEPHFVTSPRVHVDSTTHKIKSTTYTAKVETTVVAKKGWCETYVPSIVKERPTVTVWIDTTTTSHYYSVTSTETQELVLTHQVTETSTCFKEIGRKYTEIAPPQVTNKPPPSNDGSGGEYSEPPTKYTTLSGQENVDGTEQVLENDSESGWLGY